MEHKNSPYHQGAIRLGSVRTEQVKRTAKELVKRFPDKFTHDFENNKHMVNSLVQGGTPKVRNQIAGYITRFLAAEAAEEELGETEIVEEKTA
jgi:small subunit ribosomal protein S17e